MKITAKFFAAVFLLVFGTTLLSGCEQPGPAEKAGKEVDKAFDAAKKKIDEATR